MTSPIVHFEFAGPDEQRLQQFYSQLFGWQINAMGPGYALVETPDGSPNGAIREAETAELSIGVQVDDLVAAVELCTENGATVVMPPTDNGYVNKAQISDPAGNLVTLIEADRSDASK